MFGIHNIKVGPSEFVIQFRDGEAVRSGMGLSFWYFAPTASLVRIPLESVDAPFMFTEITRDYQDVSVQGQVTFRIKDPKALAAMMNFTVTADAKNYLSEDPQKLPQRVVNAVQVQVRSRVQALPLLDLLAGAAELQPAVRAGLKAAEGLTALGVEITDLSILAVKPTVETSRALEAKVREMILKEADDALYIRRNAAIEQERAVKENELNTEIAVEQKKRQIRETQLEAERAVLDKRQAISKQELAGQTALEEQRKNLVALAAANSRSEADTKAYGVSTLMQALQGADARVLQALLTSGNDPASHIAMAFQNLAENASKVGELNITPDLLQQLIEPPKKR